jgi:serine protease Do
VVSELLSTGQVSPVWMGLFGQNVDQRVAAYYGLKKPQGLLVTEVHPGSPAAKAGLKPGDLVQEVGGVRVGDKGHYLDILKNHIRGESVAVKLRRGAETLTVNVDPAPLTGELIQALVRDRWGFTPAQAKQSQGVLIESVRPGSPAQRMELAPGDLLVQVGNTRIRGLADCVSAAMASRLQNNVILGVVRGGKLYYARLVL